MKTLSKFNPLLTQQLVSVQGGSGTISILDTDMESKSKPIEQNSSRATEELFGYYH